MNIKTHSITEINNYLRQQAAAILPVHHHGVCQRCGHRTNKRFLYMADDDKMYCGKCVNGVNNKLRAGRERSPKPF